MTQPSYQDRIAEIRAASDAMLASSRRLLAAEQAFAEFANDRDMAAWWRLHTDIIEAQAAYNAAGCKYAWLVARCPGNPQPA